MGSQKTKEDDVARISTSIFITNFPETCSAKDLFNTCKQYGHVVDAFIPFKRSKAGKRFGFVRFINVFSVERLVGNLCTIWIDIHRLHANISRFQRSPVNANLSASAFYGGGKNVPNTEVNTSRYTNQKPTGIGSKYVNVVKGTMSGHVDSEYSPAVVLDDECVYSKDLSKSLLGRVKEFTSLTNLKTVLYNEGFVDMNVRYMGELWVMLEFSSSESKDLFRDNVGVGSWFSEVRQASIEFNPYGRIVWVEVERVPLKFLSGNTCKRRRIHGSVNKIDDEDKCGGNSDTEEVPETVFDESIGPNGNKSDDPFGIYSILNKNAKDKNDTVNEENQSHKYPPGFTPNEEENAKDKNAKEKNDKVNEENQSHKYPPGFTPNEENIGENSINCNGDEGIGRFHCNGDGGFGVCDTVIFKGDNVDSLWWLIVLGSRWLMVVCFVLGSWWSCLESWVHNVFQ
ncbi:nucleotide-binding alpha-beta plait domain-containing protein [Artemisia annua]|uniref:Nucleotide-binding alpha-beta plait domain-containing protein n=1 Tax=Artemisia annua TaxID=35608 RepID=A0A2U1PJW2_ARTAN|nr:nucleotide-binding alpha-beta plait domain-containing protein [Artemisia annua]